MLKRVALIAGLCLLPGIALAQQAVLQGGSQTAGHIPQYANTGGSTAVIMDGGTAAGGAVGVNPAEIGITARGTGTAPYDAQGHGPNGEIGCLYDAPTTNATGYHSLCLSPNVGSKGVLSYQAGGTASSQDFNFKINGNTITLPSATGTLPTITTPTTTGAYVCTSDTAGNLINCSTPLTPTVATVATLRAGDYSGSALLYLQGYRGLNDGGEGILSLMTGDSTTVDDGACVFVDAAGSRFLRPTCSTSLTARQAGAYGDRIEVASSAVTIGAGSTNLTVVGASFVAADVGKYIAIPAAGAASGMLGTTISSVTDGTHVVVANAAQTSVSAVAESVAYGHNDTGTLTSALSVSSGRSIPLNLESYGYILTGGITVPNTSTRLIGSNAILDANQMASGVAVTFSESASSSQSLLATSRVISSPNGGFTILCTLTGGGYGTMDGIGFAGATSEGAASVSIQDAAVQGCYKGINLSTSAVAGAGLTDVTFLRMRIQSGTYAIYAPASTVASEKVAFDDGILVNNLTAAVYLDTPLVDLHLNHTSVDGSGTGLYTNGGTITFVNGHMEAITNFYADATGGGAGIYIGYSSIGVSGTPRSQLPFHADTTTSNLVLDNVQMGLFTGSTYSPDTVIGSGAGRFVVSNLQPSTQASTALYPYSLRGNPVRNYDFTTANINGWSVTSGTVAHDATVGHDALGSIKFSPDAVTNATAIYPFACAPSQVAAIQMYGLTSGMVAATGSVDIGVSYWDIAGNLIRADGVHLTSELASWTREAGTTNVVTQGYIPAGTATCAVRIAVNHGTAPFTFWADDVYAYASTPSSVLPQFPLPVTIGGTGRSTLTANAPLFGNGASTVALGTRSGNTTAVVTTTGALTSTHFGSFDANGNLVDSTYAIGTSGAAIPLLNGNNTWGGTNGFGAVTATSVTHTGTVFASLPTPAAGMIAYVTDGAAGNCGDGTCTTFGTAVTGGGGAIPLLVWYNGTGWTLMGK